MQIESTEVKNCRLCGSSNLDVLLDYGLMPMAGGFVPADDERVDMKAPLRLGTCLWCGLMQTLDSVHPDVLFAEYSYRSSLSPALRDHFREVATTVAGLARTTDDPLVVEIGCNDGILLKPLQAFPIRTVGIDPSDVALRAAKEEGFTLVNEYATSAIAEGITREYGKATVVVACNVLAHTDDIHAMIEAARVLLADDGVLVIEVQYRGALLEKVQFDTVYHEHCSYFSLANLVRLLQEHGLVAWSVQLIDTHSGSIRIYASLASFKMGFTLDSVRLQLTKEHLDDPSTFAASAMKARDRIRGVIDFLFRASASVGAYGAAGRATILLNWCKLTRKDVAFVFDSSPLRQGKVVPGVGIPIVGAGQFREPDVFLITAWNYTDSIMRQHPHYGGLWMIPLPEVRLL